MEGWKKHFTFQVAVIILLTMFYVHEEAQFVNYQIRHINKRKGRLKVMPETAPISDISYLLG